MRERMEQAKLSPAERRMDKHRMRWPRGVTFPYPMVDSVVLMQRNVWPYWADLLERNRV